jgi:RNase P subunit RPR2
MANIKKQKCPECSGKLWVTMTDARGAGGPDLLPQVGGFWHTAKIRIVVCESCGLTRFYADTESASKLSTSDGWTLLD